MVGPTIKSSAMLLPFLVLLSIFSSSIPTASALQVASSAMQLSRGSNQSGLADVEGGSDGGDGSDADYDGDSPSPPKRMKAAGEELFANASAATAAAASSAADTALADAVLVDAMEDEEVDTDGAASLERKAHAEFLKSKMREAETRAESARGLLSLNAAVFKDKTDDNIVIDKLALQISLLHKNHITLITYGNSVDIIAKRSQNLKSFEGHSGLIDKLDVHGATNMYGGLETAYDMLAEDNIKDEMNEILLFTDGVPNRLRFDAEWNAIATEQYVAQFQARIAQSVREGNKTPQRTTLRTIGFGYELNAKLLEELATTLNGSFSYICDKSMIGTIFVSMIADILVTMPVTDVLI